MKTYAPILLIMATLLVQLSSGINYVTIPVVMDGQGIGNTAIGIAMAFEIIGVLLFYRPLSRYLSHFGILISLLILTLFRSLSLLLMAHAGYYGLWLISIFSYGLSTGMLLVLLQTWLNISVQGKTKGLMMGLYSSALSCGIALGPIIVQLIHLTIEWRFETGALITLLPLLLCLGLKARGQAMHRLGVVRFSFAFRHAKIILVAAFVGGISFFGLPGFLTLYGLHNGLSEPQAQLLLTMFMTGSVSLGILMSAFASILNRRTVVLCCIFGSVVCAVFLSMAVYAKYWVALALLFVWGGCMGGIYGIGLTVMGERFCQQDQMSANMSYTLMDSFGGITGLLLIGAMLDTFGSEGMTTVFIVFGCLLLIFAVYEMLVPRRTYE
ncbi:MFS transporter [Vibrio gazogenes]|uniref:Cyanate permease n=1 Tax=Vibrio gazogenes DSM 21264 = NBRC 103151 TaxID=1123492 RepID=A0A1M4UWG9_VIBGA|nr:MFS transporter [Vibrio gazogenes]USP15662.1 MFS transporter [Vibrio gazogenes]SHE61035.1 Cyanate permease [Vibrio gazogenes DSM 21264] [Vibrio gazogenes DSM 21264 = NBRC 103151]SJN56110.1 Major Facilitator Superfamily protein [Vibrio gazogenes]